MPASIPCVIRPMELDDAPAVFGSWVNALADELEIARDIELRRAFAREQTPVLRRLVKRGPVLVAAARKDPRNVLGWIAYELPDILHFIYVKRDFRRFHIATALLEASMLPDVCRASHSTHWGFPRVATYFETLTHDPQLGVPK